MNGPKAFSTDSASATEARAPARRHLASPPVLPLFIGDSVAIVIALLITSLSVDHGVSSNQISLLGFSALVPDLIIIPELAIVVVWQLTLALSGAYTQHTLKNLKLPLRQTLLATLFMFGNIAIADITFLDSLPIELFSLTLPLGILLLFAVRLIVRKMMIKRRLLTPETQPHMVLSADDPFLEFLTHAGQDAPHIVGQIYVEEALKARSPIDFILERLISSKARILLVSPSCNLNPQQAQALRWALEDADIQMSFLLPVQGVSENRLQARIGLKAAIIDIRHEDFNSWYFHSKRVWDVILASLSVVALTPVWISVALGIKLSDGGPVFFRQVRVGFRGQHFTMFKFRTMKSNAEEQLQEMMRNLEINQDSGNEILFKLKSDPRITKFGHFLRRYSIDELPQLFNVLRGDMTLIGPRPPLPQEVARYEARVHHKFFVKPGLTGLWQTMGRSNLTWEDSVYLDLYYTENCNPWLDFSILVNTVRTVLFPNGAY